MLLPFLLIFLCYAILYCPQLPLFPYAAIAVPITKAISISPCVFSEHPFSLIQHLHGPSPSCLPLVVLPKTLKIWSHFHVIVYFSYFSVLPNLNQTSLANFKIIPEFLTCTYTFPYHVLEFNSPLYMTHMVATSPKKKSTTGIPQKKYRSPSRVKKRRKAERALLSPCYAGAHSVISHGGTDN